MDTKQLLSQRNKAKKHKPPFVVKAANYLKKIKRRWRLPRGLHSGTRQYHKGKPVMPTPGFGSPKAVFGLHRSGVKPVVVRTERELLAIDVKSEAAVLMSTLGGRSRVRLLSLATEKKIPVLFVKDVPAKVAELKKAVAARSSLSKQLKKKKQDRENEQKLKSEKSKEEKQAKSDTSAAKKKAASSAVKAETPKADVGAEKQ